jgi:hypothetical protein
MDTALVNDSTCERFNSGTACITLHFSCHVRLSKTKELHVIRAPNGHSVTGAWRVNALHAGSPDGPRVSALGIIGLCALWLVVVVAKDTGPLLRSFLVVLRA